MTVSVLVLAAGHGTRMRSSVPKVLHPLSGKPLIRYAIETANALSDQKPTIVIGHGAEAVRQAVGENADFVLQEPQLGTGHAVLCAQPTLESKAGQVLVFAADMPLLTAETLKALIDLQKESGSVMAMMSIISAQPRGFGRVIRNAAGDAVAIVEEAHATPEQLRINELNAGVYCFDSRWLWPALKQIKISTKGEYYLTDLLQIAVEQGKPVKVHTAGDASEALGINTRVHLAEAGNVLRQRVNTALMLSGVTITDPASTFIEPGVQIGQDTVIQPNTHLRGKTVIGADCVIGPNTIVQDTTIGNGCTILASVLEWAVVEDDVEMGPFCHLRKGAHLAAHVHMGNFGEVKDSYLGPGTKMGHFSYIGNARIGANVNIGAGTITCNYDGERKHQTVLEDNVFVGSDTMLVAPVKMGEGARSGAGAVVTKDVPPHTIVVGVPAHPIEKKEKSE